MKLITLIVGITEDKKVVLEMKNDEEQLGVVFDSNDDLKDFIDLLTGYWLISKYGAKHANK